MKIKEFIFCLVIILSSVVMVVAQDANETSLNGRVMDMTGAAAPNMKINIQDKKGKTFRFLETDADGFYSTVLPAGIYSIEVKSGIGLFGYILENYRTAPTKMTLDIVLEININAPTTCLTSDSQKVYAVNNQLRITNYELRIGRIFSSFEIRNS